MTLELGDHVWYWNRHLSFDQNIPRADWFPGASPSDPTDYLGHGQEIYNFVVHAGVIARGRPHQRNAAGNFAWLNNNPGNIVGALRGPDLGQYPGKFNSHGSLVFPTRQAGYDAIGKLLRTAPYVNSTIVDAFLKYTPVREGNDPIAYASAVAARLGIAASTRVGELDDQQMTVMQDQITDIEGVLAGDALPWDSDEIPAEIRHLLPSTPQGAVKPGCTTFTPTRWETFRGTPLALYDFTAPRDDSDVASGMACTRCRCPRYRAPGPYHEPPHSDLCLNRTCRHGAASHHPP
jgi:hypothetical protein